MESKWGYQLTQKADADLDDIVGYTKYGDQKKTGG